MLTHLEVEVHLKSCIFSYFLYRIIIGGREPFFTSGFTAVYLFMYAVYHFFTKL